MLRRFSRFRTDVGGASALEFALLTPAVLGLLFGVIIVGDMYFDQSTLQSAVELGGRQLVISPTMTQTQLGTYISGQLGDIGSPTVSVNLSSTTVGGVTESHIVATFSRTFSVPMVGDYTANYSADTYVPS